MNKAKLFFEDSMMFDLLPFSLQYNARGDNKMMIL
jgi:hypothetical protein